MDSPLPRITIKFCVQCKWNLRAAYFAQELLSTFSTSLGEVALQPSTGGIFIVTLYYVPPSGSQDASSTAETAEPVTIQTHLLWDRKAEGGFPETKELKRRVRNIIDPSRDLGHIDRHDKPAVPSPEPTPSSSAQAPSATSLSPSSSSKNAYLTGPPLPKALNRLQVQEAQALEGGDSGNDSVGRKFTPMDVDTSLPGTRVSSSAVGEKEGAGPAREVLNSRGMVVISGGEQGEGDGGAFYCRPGDEDCG